MYLPDEKSIVGRNLQILINQKNWSIKQAAKELNYDRINLSKMLSGSQNFRIKTFSNRPFAFIIAVTTALQKCTVLVQQYIWEQYYQQPFGGSSTLLSSVQQPPL